MWEVIKWPISLSIFLEGQITDEKLLPIVLFWRDTLYRYFVGEELKYQGMTQNFMKNEVTLWNVGHGADAFSLWEGESRIPRERICGGGIPILRFFSFQNTVIGGGRGAGEEKSRSFLKAWSVSLKSVGDTVFSCEVPCGDQEYCQQTLFRHCICLLAVQYLFSLPFPSRGVSAPRALLWVSVE